MRTAQELCTITVRANDRSGVPASTLGALGHCIIQALCMAALAARCFASVATALAARTTHEVAARTFAANPTWTRTDVTATCAASTALELVSIGVDASHRIRCASSALGHRVFIAWLPLVAALTAR